MPRWRFDLPQARVNFVDENYFKSPKIEIPAGTLTNKIHFSCLVFRNCGIAELAQESSSAQPPPGSLPPPPSEYPRGLSTGEAPGCALESWRRAIGGAFLSVEREHYGSARECRFESKKCKGETKELLKFLFECASCVLVERC